MVTFCGTLHHHRELEDMNAGPGSSQMLQLVTAVVLLFALTTAHLIVALPVARPNALLPIYSFQVFATHTKLVPQPLPSEGTIQAPAYHSTADIIGPIVGGAIVATPIIVYNPPQFVEHQLVQYSATNGAPVATPLKLLFTRFPPFFEAIVQRIQNYFSTYNHVSNENYPASPPKNKPLPPDTTNTATLAPVSATNEMQTTTTEEPTTTTEEPSTATEEPTTTETPTTIVNPTTTTNPPLSNNAEPETGNGIYGVTNCDETTKTPTLLEEEESSRNEMSVDNPLR